MKSGTCSWGSRALLACVALSFAPGCSYLLVSGPPAEHERMAYFDCTTSRAAPIVDALFATSYAATAVTAFTVSRDTRNDAKALAATSAAIAIFEAASAATGFSRTAKCEQAKKQWAEQNVSRRATTCGTDLDCKGERICERGLCTQPTVPTPAAPQLPPTARKSGWSAPATRNAQAEEPAFEASARGKHRPAT